MPCLAAESRSADEGAKVYSDKMHEMYKLIYVSYSTILLIKTAEMRGSSDVLFKE